MLLTWRFLTSASIRRDYWQHRAHPFAKSAKGWGTHFAGNGKDQRLGHPPRIFQILEMAFHVNAMALA